MPNLVLSGLFYLLTVTLCQADTIHHELTLRFHLADGVIEVSDRLHLPESMWDNPEFFLSANLKPRLEQGELIDLSGQAASRFRRYRYLDRLDDGVLQLRYWGRLDNRGPRGDHGMPVGLVGEQGVYLDGAAGWYPAFEGQLQTYRFNVELPPGWKGVSVGVRSQEKAGTVWQITDPQEDIYLLAGPFNAYQCRSPNGLLEVFLLQEDAALAQHYLDTAGPYLALYSDLLGPYPYKRFAVVENRWQTGYGMPSFTLLGSRVLRLPFILHSSLPHEIVHNWWGNGVFLDAEGGNWSEGLTAYLADHLIKEMAGQGADYRRKALERYANFAAKGRDFPLADFRARHDDSSQAVGYSKSLMLFHMLRRDLGDKAFLTALRRFYQDYRYRFAGFSDLLGTFKQQGLDEAAGFGRDWLERAGAPAIALADAHVEGNRLSLSLKQTQDGPVYPLRVPVAVTLAGEREARWFEVAMKGKTAKASWSLPARPLRVDVDPAFDLFRLLLPGERPSSLARLFGSERQYLVLPSEAEQDELQAWHRLAQHWQARYRNVRVIDDRAVDGLPADAAVWLLGWENRLARDWSRRFANSQQTLLPTAAQISGDGFEADSHAVVLLDPDNSRPSLGFIGARGAQAIIRLASKLTHYGSFGRLVFDLPTVENRLREVLAVTHSPLNRVFGDQAVSLVLPASPLLTAQLPSPEAWRQVTCK